MPGGRVLPAAALLTASCLTILSADDEVVFEIVTPNVSDVLIDETVFSFSVEPRDPPLTRIDVYVGGIMVGTATEPDWTLVWNAGTDNAGKPILAAGFAGDELVSRSILQTRQVAAVEKVTSRLVQLYPVVLDRRGRYITNLLVEDFAILDQGQPIEIGRFSTGETELIVALVIDVSQSMEGRLGHVQLASSGFADRLRPRDRATVYSFNRGLHRVVSLTDDKDEIKQGIRAMRPGGGTAVFDALAGVLDDLREISGRKSILLYSDGRDELSTHSLTSVVEKAREGNVVIHSVTSMDPDELAAWKNPLARFADETGGRTIRINKPAKLVEAYEQLFLELRAQYLIAYRPPTGPAGLREVEVRTTRGSVRARRFYSYRPAGGS